MDNLRNLPDIQAALAKGTGDAIRYSDIHETSKRYFAISVLRENQLIGACRAALPTHRMQELVTHIRSTLILAVVVGLVLTLLLSLIATEIVTSPIRRFLRTAQLIADGRTTSQVSGNSSDELG
jgi:methyl-accepting chemotaxis protein